MKWDLSAIQKLANKGMKVVGLPDALKNGIKPKISKYRSQIKIVDGIKFRSKKEACRYSELRLLEKIGEISGLQIQVPYLLAEDESVGFTLTYFADFEYFDRGGNLVVEDVKPRNKKTQEYYLTPLFKKKAKLMLKKYGIVVKIV